MINIILICLGGDSCDKLRTPSKIQNYSTQVAIFFKTFQIRFIFYLYFLVFLMKQERSSFTEADSIAQHSIAQHSIAQHSTQHIAHSTQHIAHSQLSGELSLARLFQVIQWLVELKERGSTQVCPVSFCPLCDCLSISSYCAVTTDIQQQTT